MVFHSNRSARRVAWVCVVALFAALAAQQHAHSEAAVAGEDESVPKAPRKAIVHIHPQTLSDKDVLKDGEHGDRIDLAGATTLIWVDLMPDARFAHPTEYVLISAEGTRVVKGNWWPHLNGRDVLRGDEGTKVESPIRLGGG